MAWKPEFFSSVSMPFAFMIRTIIFYISYANSLFKFFIQIFYTHLFCVFCSDIHIWQYKYTSRQLQLPFLSSVRAYARSVPADDHLSEPEKQGIPDHLSVSGLLLRQRSLSSLFPMGSCTSHIPPPSRYTSCDTGIVFRNV